MLKCLLYRPAVVKLNQHCLSKYCRFPLVFDLLYSGPLYSGSVFTASLFFRGVQFCKGFFFFVTVRCVLRPDQL